MKNKGLYILIAISVIITLVIGIYTVTYIISEEKTPTYSTGKALKLNNKDTGTDTQNLDSDNTITLRKDSSSTKDDPEVSEDTTFFSEDLSEEINDPTDCIFVAFIDSEDQDCPKGKSPTGLKFESCGIGDTCEIDGIYCCEL